MWDLYINAFNLFCYCDVFILSICYFILLLATSSALTNFMGHLSLGVLNLLIGAYGLSTLPTEVSLDVGDFKSQGKVYLSCRPSKQNINKFRGPKE